MRSFQCRWVLMGLSLSIVFTGCSTIKTVSVITDPGTWPIGQHDYCAFKGNKLLCVPQGTKISAPLELLKRQANGEKISIEEILFVNSVNYMSDVEENLETGDEKAQVRVFDTKFSEKPNDYSIWNCISTGKGSPAVECQVMRQPSSKDREFIAGKVKEQDVQNKATRMEQDVQNKATRMMIALTEKTLQDRCGAPLQRTEDTVSVSELYKGESTLLAFHFSTYPKPKDDLTVASSLDSPPPSTLDQNAVLSGNHKWFGRSSKEEAVWLVNQMPCLKR